MYKAAIFLIFIHTTWCQPYYYYQQQFGPQSLPYNSNNGDSSKIEQKYVNSGQSIELVCDLPNNMPDGKVVFIKSDNKYLTSGIDIREDSDDQRFEISQQYAWEWSLKINSINEDDSGFYFCKVGNTVIQQFEIVVRVPPRIRDDGDMQQRTVIEGSNVVFSCFASGTPKPNITWYVISPQDQSLQLLPQQTGNYLRLENVTRYTPRRYQCRASNNIPPSDTRNITLTVQFPPEVDVQAKLNAAPDTSTMMLNCTISALPLTNRFFWRKDARFVTDDVNKYEIRNTRLNEYTLVSQLLIKNYNEQDQGLYECTAENDLRVSKIVYNLRERPSQLTNVDFRPNQNVDSAATTTTLGTTIAGLFTPEASTTATTTTTTRHHHKNRKNYNRQRLHHHKKNKSDFNEDDINSIEMNHLSKGLRSKHLRNHRNMTKMPYYYQYYSTTPSTETTMTTSADYDNSPFIIQISDDNSNNSNENVKQNNSANIKHSAVFVLFLGASFTLFCYHY